MLLELRVENYAVIDSLAVEFAPGLNLLTGETGAGKSILVDALQLLAGGRAGAEVVRHGAERAEITGNFDLRKTPRELKRWLDEQSIVAGDELSIANLRYRLEEALNEPAVKDQFTSVGLEIVANTPEQFAAFQQKEFARWKQLIETRKITAD